MIQITLLEWHDVEINSKIIGFFSQLAARAFLGEKLGRDPEWIQVSSYYARDSVIAATAIRKWPVFLRRLGNWVTPACYTLRDDLKNARRLVEPLLQERRLEKEVRAKNGLKAIEYLDALQWMEDAANGQAYDPAASQVILALAANFTSSDACTKLILDLCVQPELVKDLRKEIVEVLGRDGAKWDKSAFYKLALMDSVLKESMRLKPLTLGMYS